MNFTFDIGVPEMYDLTITLNGPEGFDVAGREVNFTDPLGLLPMDVVSDETVLFTSNFLLVNGLSVITAMKTTS